MNRLLVDRELLKQRQSVAELLIPGWRARVAAGGPYARRAAMLIERFERGARRQADTQAIEASGTQRSAQQRMFSGALGRDAEGSL